MADLFKEGSVGLDQNYLDELSFVLNYGFQDQLEVQMNLEHLIASANLKRGDLREEESLLVRKYSRRTEIEFVLFGIVTQCQGGKEEDNDADDDEVEDFDGMKEALMSLVKQLTNVETTFTGRLKNEIIIDPIALYSEI